MQIAIKHIENSIIRETCTTHVITVCYTVEREVVFEITDLSITSFDYFKLFHLYPGTWVMLIVAEKMYSEAGKCTK